MISTKTPRKAVPTKPAPKPKGGKGGGKPMKGKGC